MNRTRPDRGRAALDYVRTRAEELRDGLPTPVPESLLERVRDSGVITVNFHPDRAGPDGRTTIEGLLADGVFRTQFSTGTSSGGLDAMLGGARSRWEKIMFGAAYAGADGDERPRYGGLDLVDQPLGACPRFGSCVVRLRPEVRARSTFSWGDSVTEPTAVGVWGTLEPVLAAAATDLAPELDGHPRPQRDQLDGYIEVQLHQPVTLEQVAAVVADPSFRGTTVGRQLEELARRSGTTLRWHRGRTLAPDRFDPGLRGPLSPRLARAIHRWGARPGHQVDAELIGRAARDVLRHGGRWSDFGDPDQVGQELKYLWHHLVVAGEPW